MNESDSPRSYWTDFLALAICFIGEIVSVGGAVYVLLSEMSITGEPVWPLPGLVLLDWALLGAAGFLIPFFSFKKQSGKWLQAFWFCTGGFLPLILLGAFSIAPLVLIALTSFLISTVLLSLRRKSKWLQSLGFLMLGAICNLGLLLLFISIGQSGY